MLTHWLLFIPRDCCLSTQLIMSRENQRCAVREIRESLMLKLDVAFKQAFDAIDPEVMGEGSVARLTQLLLVTRAQAMASLEKEIEAPLITRPPRRNHS